MNNEHVTRYLRHKVKNNTSTFSSLTSYYSYIKNQVTQKKHGCVDRNSMIRNLKYLMTLNKVSLDKCIYHIKDEETLINNCAYAIKKTSGTIYTIVFLNDEKSGPQKIYVGLTQLTLKQRMRSHISDAKRKNGQRNSRFMQQLRQSLNPESYKITAEIENVAYYDLSQNEEDVLLKYATDSDFDVLNTASSGSAFGRSGSHFVMCEDNEERHLSEAVRHEISHLNLSDDESDKLQSRIKALYLNRKNNVAATFITCVKESVAALQRNQNVNKADAPLYQYQHEKLSVKQIAQKLNVDKAKISSRLERLKSNYDIENVDLFLLLNDPKNHKPKVKSKTLQDVLNNRHFFDTPFARKMEIYCKTFSPQNRHTTPNLGGFLKDEGLFKHRSAFYHQTKRFDASDDIMKNWSRLYDRYKR